MLVNQFT